MSKRESQDPQGSVKFIARRVLPLPSSQINAQIASPDGLGQGFPEQDDHVLPLGGHIDRGPPAHNTRLSGTGNRQHGPSGVGSLSPRVADPVGTTSRKASHGHPRFERSKPPRARQRTGQLTKATSRRTKLGKRTLTGALQRALGTTHKTDHAIYKQTSQQIALGQSGSQHRYTRHEGSDHKSGISMAPSGHSTNCSDSANSTETDALDIADDDPEGEVEVLLQPQTRPITLDQLVIEVRTIYEVVVQFEDKAIRLDEEHTIAAKVDLTSRRKMSKDDYMAYIALHKALLHEHHDLCLASQHPAASESLRQLPERYSIPARMWRHGVHAPLEVLRMRLPESREHMIAFILISFNHMTLFLETVPQFEATWLECIGDLGRYRLALAETDEEREIFSGIARDWYSRAIQLNPQISRLYHHMAILAPSFSLEQLSLYGRALTGQIPFLPTRKSITALFKPVLTDDEQLTKQISPATMTILRAHAALALGGPGSRAEFNRCLSQIRGGLFLQLFADAADQQEDAKRLGAHLAIAESASMLQYGVTRGNGSSVAILRLCLGMSSHGAADFDKQIINSSSAVSAANVFESLTAGELLASRITVKASCTLAFEMFSVALRHPKDEDMHSFVHIMFVMVLGFANAARAIPEIECTVPWHDMAGFLNTFSNAASMSQEICSSEFPVNAGGYQQILPEDYMLQGLVFAKDYLPADWTEPLNPDLTEQEMEFEYMTAVRLQRVLWVGHKISVFQKWLFFDEFSREFEAGFAMEGLSMDEEASDFMPLLPDTGFG